MTAALTAATLVTLCSIVGAVLTASTSAPQLRRLHRTRNVAGLSATTSAFTVVSGLSWSAYASAEHLPVLLVSSMGAVTVQVPVLALLARAGAWPWRNRLLAAVLAVFYAEVALMWGWTVLGAVLVGHAVIQYTPQVVTVLRSDDVAGVSPVSATIMLTNGMVWGLAGLFSGALPLMAWAVVVSSSATVILVRVSGSPAWLMRAGGSLQRA